MHKASVSGTALRVARGLFRLWLVLSVLWIGAKFSAAFLPRMMLVPLS